MPHNNKSLSTKRYNNWRIKQIVHNKSHHVPAAGLVYICAACRFSSRWRWSASRGCSSSPCSSWSRPTPWSTSRPAHACSSSATRRRAASWRRSASTSSSSACAPCTPSRRATCPRTLTRPSSSVSPCKTTLCDVQPNCTDYIWNVDNIGRPFSMNWDRLVYV